MKDQRSEPSRIPTTRRPLAFLSRLLFQEAVYSMSLGRKSPSQEVFFVRAPPYEEVYIQSCRPSRSLFFRRHPFQDVCLELWVESISGGILFSLGVESISGGVIVRSSFFSRSLENVQLYNPGGLLFRKSVAPKGSLVSRSFNSVGNYRAKA